MPTTPQKLAGCRTEPPVSEPSAAGTTPAATSAADPPDDPPGTRLGSSGCFTRPNAECSVEEPMANSSMLALAAIIAPAARSRFTAVAVYGETYPSRMRDAQVVGASMVTMLSLIAIGTDPGTSSQSGACCGPGRNRSDAPSPVTWSSCAT